MDVDDDNDDDDDDNDDDDDDDDDNDNDDVVVVVVPIIEVACIDSLTTWLVDCGGFLRTGANFPLTFCVGFL